MQPLSLILIIFYHPAQAFLSNDRSIKMMSDISGGVVDKDMLERVAAGKGSTEDNAYVSEAAIRSGKALRGNMVLNGNKVSFAVDSDGNVGFTSLDGSNTVNYKKEFKDSISGRIASFGLNGVDSITISEKENFARYGVQESVNFIGQTAKSALTGKIKNLGSGGGEGEVLRKPGTVDIITAGGAGTKTGT